MKKALYYLTLVCLLAIAFYSASGILKEKNSERIVKEKQEEIKQLIAKPKVEFNDIITMQPLSFQKMTKDAFNKLKARNKDVVGILWFNAGNIIEPILQSTNNDMYLYRDIDGDYSDWGSVFMNAANRLNDTNITIYGHSSNSKPMKFTDLMNINNESYHKIAHFSIYYEDTIKLYEISYAYHYGNFNEFDHQVANFSKQSFDEYINFIKSRNILDSQNTIEYGDKFISLQSCYGSAYNERFVVVAKEIGEVDYEH